MCATISYIGLRSRPPYYLSSWPLNVARTCVCMSVLVTGLLQQAALSGSDPQPSKARSLSISFFLPLHSICPQRVLLTCCIHSRGCCGCLSVIGVVHAGSIFCPCWVLREPLNRTVGDPAGFWERTLPCSAAAPAAGSYILCLERSAKTAEKRFAAVMWLCRRALADVQLCPDVVD